VGHGRLAWVTVLTGTWIIYPWYREALAGETCAGCAGLSLPEAPRVRRRISCSPTCRTGVWHTFGMEWKEHIAWIAPILATAVAFLVTYYGPG
jgi:hypothetical protein